MDGLKKKLQGVPGTSRIEEVAEYIKNNPTKTYYRVGINLGLSTNTVRNYVKRSKKEEF